MLVCTTKTVLCVGAYNACSALVIELEIVHQRRTFVEITNSATSSYPHITCTRASSFLSLSPSTRKLPFRNDRIHRKIPAQMIVSEASTAPQDVIFVTPSGLCCHDPVWALLAGWLWWPGRIASRDTLQRQCPIIPPLKCHHVYVVFFNWNNEFEQIPACELLPYSSHTTEELDSNIKATEGYQECKIQLQRAIQAGDDYVRRRINHSDIGNVTAIPGAAGAFRKQLTYSHLQMASMHGPEICEDTTSLPPRKQKRFASDSVVAVRMPARKKLKSTHVSNLHEHSPVRRGETSRVRINEPMSRKSKSLQQRTPLQSLKISAGTKYVLEGTNRSKAGSAQLFEREGDEKAITRSNARENEYMIRYGTKESGSSLVSAVRDFR